MIQALFKQLPLCWNSEEVSLCLLPVRAVSVSYRLSKAIWDMDFQRRILWRFLFLKQILPTGSLVWGSDFRLLRGATTVSISPHLWITTMAVWVLNRPQFCPSFRMVGIKYILSSWKFVQLVSRSFSMIVALYLVLVLICFGEEMSSWSSYLDILTLYLLVDIFNSSHSKGDEPHLIVILIETSLKSNHVECLFLHLLVFMKYMLSFALFSLFILLSSSVYEVYVKFCPIFIKLFILLLSSVYKPLLSIYVKDMLAFLSTWWYLCKERKF